MTPEEKRKEETALMTTWLATEVMGLKIYDEEDIDEIWETEPRPFIERRFCYDGRLDIHTKDGKTIFYRPTEIFEQATSGAFKLGWDICLTGDIAMSGWHVDCTRMRKLITVSRYTPHSENANIIVTTLYEEGKRNE